MGDNSTVSTTQQHQALKCIKMHIAIKKSCRDTVIKLLRNGASSLCTITGTNCFTVASTRCAWTFVNFLLEQNPEGIYARDAQGKTLLMIYAHRSYVVSKLLERGADPLAVSYSGKTALMYCMEHPEVNLCAIERLIEGNVAVNARCQKGHNALTLAVINVKSFHLEILKTLIEAGVNPLVELPDGENVLTISTQYFFKLAQGKIEGIKMTNKKLTLVGKALTYLFELPHFKSPEFRFNCAPELHPQIIHLREMCKYNNVNIFKEVFQPHLIDKTLLFRSRLNEHNMVGQEIEDVNYNFNPISWCLNYDDCSASEHLCKVTIKGYVEKLLHYGFLAHVPDSMSPLTVMLTKHCSCYRFLPYNSEFRYRGYEQGPEKDDFLDASRILVERGAHVGQQMFTYCNDDLETLSVDLMLPDALYCALTFGHLGCVRYLLPYFGSPPLALLLFQEPYFLPEIFRELFPALAEWGPLPPGSRMLKLMRQIFDDPDKNIHQAIRDVFRNMHSSPCSLQHLCRGVIRKSCARTAMLDPSRNLVQIITDVTKVTCPRLKDFMTMVPEMPLDEFIFEDPDLYNLGEILCGRTQI